MQFKAVIKPGHSMDYLNFVIALDDEFGVQIPEADYTKFTNLNSCIEQLDKS